jgi:predicted nucleotidyltransferase
MMLDPREIASLAAWPEHRRILARAGEQIQKDSRVPGLLLGGSFVSGRPDFYSDLDLYIIVHDEHFEDLLAERQTAAAAAGRVLTGFVPDHLGPGGDEMYIAVYDGPVKADFNYVRRSTVKPNWRLVSRLVLKDADGTLAGAIRASAGLMPPPPSVEALEALHNKFWTWCWYVFGKIARGELWEALDGLHTIRSLALVTVAEWDAGSLQEGHRRLESRLNDQVRARLAATVSTLDPAALYSALQAEIGVFHDLQASVWPRYRVAVDEAPGRIIQEAIRRAWPDSRDVV